MNPKRQFRQLRDDDRWIGLPPTASAPRRVPTATGSRTRGARASTVIAFLIAGAVVVGLWVGLSGLHRAQPASLSPLPITTLQTQAPVRTPCAHPAQLAPIGCSTYTATAAGGVPGGTKTWTGAPPPTVTLRVLNGKVTALIGTGCNGLTVPLTVTSNTLTPTGSAASTLALCTGARSAQERWITELFNHPVSYTMAGTELRLSAGNKALSLTATTPATLSPSPRVTRAASDGCAPTTATTPSGSTSAQIGDVDGDGRPDRKWSLLVGGDMRFGITTASGATIGAREDFAGGGSRTFVVGMLGNGAVILMPSEGRSTGLWSLSGCTLHQVRSGTAETGGVTGFFGMSIAWNNDGGAAACIDGRLASLSWKTGATSRATITARYIDVTADGAAATLTDTAKVLARDVDLSSKNGARYTEISCGASPVLGFN